VRWRCFHADRARPAAALALPAIGIVLSCCGCSRDWRHAVPEEYDVYAAALSDRFVTQLVRTGPVRFLILNTTVSRPAMMSVQGDGMKANVQGLVHGQIDSGFKEAARDFYRKSKYDHALERLPLEKDYVLITAETAESLCWAARGESISSRYAPNPSGFFTLSRVGFNEDHTRAYCWVEHHLDGWGRGCLLCKQNGTWRVMVWGSGWIS
jgi:hypothetical protein